MNHPKTWQNSIVIGLLLAIIVLLIVLIVVMLWSGKDKQSDDDGSDKKIVLKSGQTATPDDLENPPEPPPKPVADPNRIRETLKEGKTYQSTVKASIEARVEDKDWGIKSILKLIYVSEIVVSRNIESNDGQKIVELRTYETCRNLKLLIDVEDVTISLGPIGYLALTGLDVWWPAAGVGTMVMSAKPIAEKLLREGAQMVSEENAKAFGYVDGLTGKQVRITYVDGQGVVSLQPIDCSLTEDERDFLMATALLSDCYLFPDLNIKPGGSWKVDGSQLISMLDPTMRGIPQGSITVVREQDLQKNGQQYANLRIESGFLRLDSSTDADYRIGTFTPRGDLHYYLEGGFISHAQLKGKFTFEKVSRDHILFESRFKTEPEIEIDYTNRILE